MKAILAAGLLACSLAVIAQTKIEKAFPLQGAQKVELVFDYPELIRIHTWDQKEIRVTGSVSINRGQNDDAFQLTSSVADGRMTISSELRDKDNIPRVTIIKKGDQEFFFKAKDASDPAVKKFLEENGHEYTYMSNGLMQEITLDIYIPKGMECRVNAKYGLVEITDFNGPLVVNAPYGGIDATIGPSFGGDLIARTKFGEILTNLDVKFNATEPASRHDHWTTVQTSLGKGPKFDFESKFGKVYLRKPAK